MTRLKVGDVARAVNYEKQKQNINDKMKRAYKESLKITIVDAYTTGGYRAKIEGGRETWHWYEDCLEPWSDLSSEAEEL